MPSLAVTGQSLAALLESSLAADITLADLADHLQDTCATPEAAQQLQIVLDQLDALQAAAAAGVDDDVGKGMGGDVAGDNGGQAGGGEKQGRSESDLETVAEAGEKGVLSAADERLRALAACRPGIHLSHSPARVVLQCEEGSSGAVAIVSLRNQGTVAVQYEWEQQDAAQHPLAAVAGGFGVGRSGVCGAAAVAAVAVSPFCCIQRAGSLLPGETHTAHITFKPTAAGENEGVAP